MRNATLGRSRSARAATRLVLPQRLRGEIESWARAGYPEETCGLLIGRANGTEVEVQDAVRARNLDVERARDRYELDPQDYLAADRRARGAGLEIVGVWHSHPEHPARPSPTDLERGWAGWSYVIVSVTRAGVQELRSWRLENGGFVEEEVTPCRP